MITKRLPPLDRQAHRRPR